MTGELCFLFQSSNIIKFIKIQRVKDTILLINITLTKKLTRQPIISKANFEAGYRASKTEKHSFSTFLFTGILSIRL